LGRPNKKLDLYWPFSHGIISGLADRIIDLFLGLFQFLGKHFSVVFGIMLTSGLYLSPSYLERAGQKRSGE